MLLLMMMMMNVETQIRLVHVVDDNDDFSSSYDFLLLLVLRKSGNVLKLVGVAVVDASGFGL